MPTPLEPDSDALANITMITVAKHAEILDGSLYGMGIGWNWAYTPLPPLTLIARAEIPAGRVENQEITIRWTLEDSDGQTITDMPDPWVAVHPSPTAPGGTHLGVKTPFWFLFYFTPLALPPGRYQFRVGLDDHERTYAFTVLTP